MFLSVLLDFRLRQLPPPCPPTPPPGCSGPGRRRQCGRCHPSTCSRSRMRSLKVNHVRVAELSQGLSDWGRGTLFTRHSSTYTIGRGHSAHRLRRHGIAHPHSCLSNQCSHLLLGQLFRRLRPVSQSMRPLALLVGHLVLGQLPLQLPNGRLRRRSHRGSVLRRRCLP